METDRLLNSAVRHASISSISTRNFSIRTLHGVSSLRTLNSSGNSASGTTKPTRNVDGERIYQAAKAAGEPAFGVVMIDVWLFQPDDGNFAHAQGGTWMCPAFVARASADERIAMERILDPQHSRYCPPRPQVMGAGLAGYFWSTMAMKPSDYNEGRSAHVHRRDCSHDFSVFSSQNDPEDFLLWRDLRALTSDPFQPPYPRMQVLQEAGLGKATGVPFEVQGTKGVVLYLTRPEADESILCESANVQYLQAAAQYVGMACALSQPRKQVGSMRQARLATTWRRLTTRIKSFPSLRKQRLAASVSHLSDDAENDFWSRIQNLYQQAHNVVQARLSLLAHKSRGSASIKPPPPAPLRTCLWTAMGVSLTLWILGLVSQVATATSGRGILFAPFGAFLTLQYSLTAAPASQPRNAIYGQCICLLLAWFWSSLFALLPVIPSTLLLPVSAATGIALMQKFGLSHPPAAAAMVAVLTQPGGFSWTSALWLLVGNATAVATATLVNNLSEHRQYPVYWQWGIVQVWQSLVQRDHGSLTMQTSNSTLGEKSDKLLVGDSPTIPTSIYYDSDGSLARQGDAENPGEDLPLQF